MRRNSNRKYWDTIYIQMPEAANTARVIVVPLKAVFINISDLQRSNVDRVFFDVDDAMEFFERWAIGF